MKTETPRKTTPAASPAALPKATRAASPSAPAAPAAKAPPAPPSRDAIAKRAYELYLARGRADGHSQEDWLKAERELLAQAHHNN